MALEYVFIGYGAALFIALLLICLSTVFAIMSVKIEGRVQEYLQIWAGVLFTAGVVGLVYVAASWNTLIFNK